MNVFSCPDLSDDATEHASSSSCSCRGLPLLFGFLLFAAAAAIVDVIPSSVVPEVAICWRCSAVSSWWLSSLSLSESSSWWCRGWVRCCGRSLSLPASCSPLLDSSSLVEPLLQLPEEHMSSNESMGRPGSQLNFDLKRKSPAEAITRMSTQAKQGKEDDTAKEQHT